MPPDCSDYLTSGCISSHRTKRIKKATRKAGGVRRPKYDTDVPTLSIARVNSSHLRTPSLRNVALTAPYMHNGAFRTLREVIEFYDTGGGATLGFDTRHQTLPTTASNLSKRERADLLAFLESLTDTSYAQRR